MFLYVEITFLLQKYQKLRFLIFCQIVSFNNVSNLLGL